MESDTCNVCIEKYSDNLRKKVSCNYCNYMACVRCTQKYLLSSIVDAHCMSCRTGWNREFLDINMTKSFRTGAWREHKKKLILNREKALLPTMQHYAAAKKSMEEIDLMISTVLKENSKATEQHNDFQKKIQVLHNNITTSITNSNNIIEKISEIDNKDSELNLLISEAHIYSKKLHIGNIKISILHNRYNFYNDIYYDFKKQIKERKEFVLKCVKDGCRGFLSSAYKCELCATLVCNDCMIIKDDKEHVCKKEDIDTVAMIRKDTRPCPKCGIRISKVDGCDQMFCVNDGCNVAFSWNTGELISGVIHNPHYYEWVRRNNSGAVPVNPIACDQRVEYLELHHAMKNVYTHSIHMILVSKIHQSLGDIQYARLPSFPDTRNIHIFKELHCEFLLNRIDETAWRQSMFLKENNFEKKQSIGLVLRTFVTVCNDNFTKYCQKLILLYNDKKFLPNAKGKGQEADKLAVKFINKSLVLRNYINTSLVKTGLIMMCAVPQINREWEWQSVRKVEYILENDPSISV